MSVGRHARMIDGGRDDACFFCLDPVTILAIKILSKLA